MTRINVKAVLIASVSMFILDLISGVVLLPLFSDVQILDGSSAEQVEQAMQAVTLSDAYLICALITGTITTLLGGYLAAKIAKKYPYFNAAAFGLMGIAISLIMSSDVPLWFDIIGYLSTIPAALYGGHFAKQQYSAKP
jgi:predicted membrane channel-forming protein YqfA (hemolysin III family)